MQSSVTICGLLLVIIPVHAHVSKNFEGCRQFFFGNVWPEWPPSRYHREICQTYENKAPPDDIIRTKVEKLLQVMSSGRVFQLEAEEYFNIWEFKSISDHLHAKQKYYFATLYDIKRHIPVYSAYIFEQGDDHSQMSWCIEPQLVNQKLDKNMMRSDVLVKKAKKPKVKLSDIEKVQAVYEDYQVEHYSDYNRGHLNPKGHHTGSSSKATFTLTNVVPQNKTLNSGAWGDYEENKLKKMIFKNCHKAYVLVGAIPSTNPRRWIKRDNKKRVNIPDYLWHAYCCTDKQGSPIKSGAATAKNTENRVQQCSLKSLEQFFGKLNKHVELFKNCNAPEQKELTGDCSSIIE